MKQPKQNINPKFTLSKSNTTLNIRKKPPILKLKHSNLPQIPKKTIKTSNSQSELKSTNLTSNISNNFKIKNIEKNSSSSNQMITAEHLKTKNAYKLYFLFKEKIPPTSSDYHWILNLRNTPVCKGSNRNKIKDGEENNNTELKISGPSFYNEDLTKYKRRFLTNSKSEADIHLKDFSKYEFLYKRKQFSNPLTVSLINTLLSYRSPDQINKNVKKLENNIYVKKKYHTIEETKNSAVSLNKNKWHISNEKILKPNTTYFPKNGGSGFLNEKYVNRPYKKTFKDIMYEGHKLRTIVFSRDDQLAYDHLGNFDDNSKFEEVLKGENYAPLEHYLTGKGKSITDCWFKLSLRKTGNINNKMVIKNK